MRFIKLTCLLFMLVLFNSCASGYKPINPSSLNYNSNHLESGVSVEYKYDLLRKKYAKKEQKKDVRLVAVKITNNSDQDLTFGRDLKLVYENGMN